MVFVRMVILKYTIVLIKHFIKQEKSRSFKDVDMHTFAKAFMFQTALEYGKREDPSAYEYVFHCPSTFILTSRCFTSWK